MVRRMEKGALVRPRRRRSLRLVAVVAEGPAGLTSPRLVWRISTFTAEAAAPAEAARPAFASEPRAAFPVRQCRIIQTQSSMRAVAMAATDRTRARFAFR